MSAPRSGEAIANPWQSGAYCRARGWAAGDLLHGREGKWTTTIRITYVGEDWVLIAKAVRRNGKPVDDGETSWTLGCRDWRRIYKAPRTSDTSSDNHSKG